MHLFLIQYIFNSSFIENVLLVLKVKVKTNLRKLREFVDRKSWLGSPPTIINAFYNPSFNEISKKTFLSIIQNNFDLFQFFQLVFFSHPSLTKTHLSKNILFLILKYIFSKKFLSFLACFQLIKSIKNFSIINTFFDNLPFV